MKSVGGLLMGVLVLLGLRELPKSISSGESETTETEGKDVFRSLQALPKEPCSASNSMEVFSTDPGMAVPMEIPQSPRSRNDEFAKSSQCNWGGVNSYFLWAMGQAEQDQILSDMQTRGLKMMRIFVSTVPRNFKSTTSQFVPFLEPRLGEYDFTALELINKFMVKVKEYGVKLAIALHDRYELGCWYCDAYHEYLGLTCLAGQPCGPLNDASKFYRNSTVIKAFDQRLETILNYKNPEMGNRRWGDLKDVVAMFEIQNEAQGLNPEPWVTHWHCDRAKVLRSLIDSEIYVGTGGGRTFAESMLRANFECPEIDVINLHDYDETTWDGMHNNLKTARDLGRSFGKKVVYEEFGRKARYYRADYHYAVITACVSLGIPFMSWEYIIPGNTDSTDYEWDDKQATWPVMVYGVLLANETPGAFSWPNLDLCSVA